MKKRDNARRWRWPGGGGAGGKWQQGSNGDADDVAAAPPVGNGNNNNNNNKATPIAAATATNNPTGTRNVPPPGEWNQWVSKEELSPSMAAQASAAGYIKRDHVDDGDDEEGEDEGLKLAAPVAVADFDDEDEDVEENGYVPAVDETDFDDDDEEMEAGDALYRREYNGAEGGMGYDGEDGGEQQGSNQHGKMKKGQGQSSQGKGKGKGYGAPHHEGERMARRTFMAV